MARTATAAGGIIVLTACVLGVVAITERGRTPNLELHVPTKAGSISALGRDMLVTGDGYLAKWTWGSSGRIEKTLRFESVAVGAFSDGYILEKHLAGSHDRRLVKVGLDEAEQAELAGYDRQWYLARTASSTNGNWCAIQLDEDGAFADEVLEYKSRIGILDDPGVALRWLGTIERESGQPSILRLAVSMDGEYVGVAGGDGVGGWLRVYAAAAPGQPIEVRQPGAIDFRALVFTPDSKLVVAGGSGGGVCAYSTHTGALEWELAAPPRLGAETRPSIEELAISPDGTKLAFGTQVDGDICVWSLPDCVVMDHFSTGQATVLGLAFSPDSSCIASLGVYGDTIKLWRIKASLRTSGGRSATGRSE